MTTLCARYCVDESELSLIPAMKELVEKAEEIVEVWRYSPVSQAENNLDVEVEPTDYVNETFGIRIYLHEYATLSIKPSKDLTSIESGKSWISITFGDKGIQFVFKSGLVPPKDLPAA